MKPEPVRLKIGSRPFGVLDVAKHPATLPSGDDTIQPNPLFGVNVGMVNLIVRILNDHDVYLREPWQAIQIVLTTAPMGVSFLWDPLNPERVQYPQNRTPL